MGEHELVRVAGVRRQRVRGGSCVAGSYSAAMRYSSRTLTPVSTRTTNGTVLPSSVVVVATSLGGQAGL